MANRKGNIVARISKSRDSFQKSLLKLWDRHARLLTRSEMRDIIEKSVFPEFQPKTDAQEAR